MVSTTPEAVEAVDMFEAVLNTRFRADGDDEPLKSAKAIPSKFTPLPPLAAIPLPPPAVSPSLLLLLFAKMDLAPARSSWRKQDIKNGKEF